MPYDGGNVYTKVELYIAGAWVEVTSRALGGRAASGVEIDRGRSTGAIQAESSRLEMDLGNADGFLTEGNPLSPWQPYVGRGCRIRVSVSDVLPADVVRFDGRIDTITAKYPGGSFSSVHIIATGSLGGDVGLGDEALNTPMYRSMIGLSEGDFVPVWYVPMEDGSSAEQFANALPLQGSATFSGAISLGGYSDAPGSASLPTVGAGGTISAYLPMFTYTGAWQLQFIMSVPSAPLSDAEYMTITTAPGTGSSTARISVYYDTGTSQMTVGIFDSSGASVALPFGVTCTFDTPLLWAITQYISGASCNTVLSQYNADGYIAQAVTGATATTVDRPTRAVASAIVNSAGWATGHWALYSDAAVITTPNIGPNAAALNGHAGELASDRIERLCREEQVDVTITGTSTQRMGPQSADTLANLLIECEAVDGGLLSDGGDGGGLAYRCLPDLYNQTASLAVLQGSLETDVAPIWDNRSVRNDVTASRPGGSSSRQTNEAHVTRTRRRIKDAPTLNVEGDGQLPDQASWRVGIGTTPAPRYEGVGINLRNPDGARLADAVLGLEMGDRFTVAEAALPPQHPPGGIDSLVIGWHETLDADTWIFAPNCVDYAPYDVAVYGTDSQDTRYGSGSTELIKGATSTGTSLTWIERHGPGWSTTDTPFNITVSSPNAATGMTYSCTALTANVATYGAVGTVTHGNNASVVPSLPASLAEGDLMLLFAAIRNSGIGVPNTPTGWTRLEVFASTDNCQLFGRYATASESAPTVSFTGGVANADTTAQIARFQACGITVHNATAQINTSAANIAYPAVGVGRNGCVIVYLGWKQDDWTSVASPGTEIDEPDTTTGDDQGIVWAYQIQTTATDIAAGSFTVTGGASAISRGAVVVLEGGSYTATVVRLADDKVLAAGDSVEVTNCYRYAL